MRPHRIRPATTASRWLLPVATSGYVLLATLALATLVWLGSDADGRVRLTDMAQRQWPTLLAGGTLALGLLALLVDAHLRQEERTRAELVSRALLLAHSTEPPPLLADTVFTVLDTETTGLHPASGDSLVSLAAFRVRGAKLVEHERFDRLINPARPIPTRSTAIHGITDEMVADAPTAATVVAEFAEWAEGTVLVGHNVGFDLQFLRRATMSAAFSGVALDTLILDELLHPGDNDRSLESLAARYGIQVVDRHTAVGDAHVTAEIFIAAMHRLRSGDIDTLDALVAACARTPLARTNRRLYRS